MLFCLSVKCIRDKIVYPFKDENLISQQVRATEFKDDKSSEEKLCCPCIPLKKNEWVHKCFQRRLYLAASVQQC